MMKFRPQPPPPELVRSDPCATDEMKLELALSGRLDDQTVAYVMATRSCFDSLRQVAAQLAGLLVLASSGGRTTVLEIPVLDLAVRTLCEARDAILSGAVPPAASHHHLHLRRAADRLGEALATTRTRSSLRDDDPTVEAILKQLREGWQELHRAARALPGFQVVDFSQACCALHGARSPRTPSLTGFQAPGCHPQ